MKNQIKISVTALLCSLVTLASAQSMEAMLTKAFNQFDTAGNEQAMMAAAIQFEIAAGKWSNEWAPNYYAAYSKAIISYVEPDTKKKDQFLDAADKYLEQAKKINDKTEETYILAALLANARLAAQPSTRWKKYGDIFNAQLEKAKSINPDNPRIYYLKGNATFYQPKAFGGGGKNAKPYYEKAMGLYAKQDSSSILKPYWGARMCAEYLKKCDE